MNTIRSISSIFAVSAAMLFVAGAWAVAQDERAATAAKEQELLAVLRSDAPAAEKAITCKRLAIHGSQESVPELAKLLSDNQLASWARIALEAIPGEAADAALRDAAESLDGLLLVGTINSIGVRGDEKAVELLAAKLKSGDNQIASAAAVALGKIGNAAATQSLRDSLANVPAEIRSAVAEGCILCAEQLHLAGKAAEAAEIYDQVRSSDVPQQRILEATRGTILARGNDGIPILLEQFRSPDKKMFQLALGTAREFPGGEVDKALADEVQRATPDRAALIVLAMADRPETVVLPAVLAAAQQEHKQVRMAAIAALQRVGNASCLDTLLKLANDADAEIATTAKATLAELPGDEIDQRIIAMLPEAKGDSYALLLGLIGQRRIDAVPHLLKALDHADQQVRGAALAALGETVTLENLDVLIRQAIAPDHAEDIPAARQALLAASVRMPDREACGKKLVAAIDDASSIATKTSLLEILGSVSGATALSAMSAAGRSDNADLQDVSTRLLGKWMTADAAPVLLDLAENAPGEKFQIRALRGYIRIARQFNLPLNERAEMCEKAFQAAQQPAEKKLVIEVLERYPSAKMLRLAIDARKIPEVRNEATRATLVIAQKLGGKGVDVEKLLANAQLDNVKLEIVKAQYGAGSTQRDVTEIVRKHAGDTPLIGLPSTSYNAAFGGDPAPGSVKQLKVQYKIDGKSGEATFAEDSLIFLPIP